jgi:hypothetical protein
MLMRSSSNPEFDPLENVLISSQLKTAAKQPIFLFFSESFRSDSTSYSGVPWSRVVLSFPCAWKNTTIRNSIAAECSEMVSNDVAVDGDWVSIDPDIRHRDWSPVLRNPALTPPPESLVESESARLVPKQSPLAGELLTEEQQADIEKLRSNLQVMTIEQAEKMTRGQAEIVQLRAELEAMTAVANDASKLPIERLEEMSVSELIVFSSPTANSLYWTESLKSAKSLEQSSILLQNTEKMQRRCGHGGD